MNYLKIYNNLILKAQSLCRNRVKGGEYYESHHIVPKCLGGGNDSSNKVLLTIKEHFIAHKLLVEIYPNEKGIWYSYFCMAFANKNKYSKYDYNISCTEYERLRVEFLKRRKDTKINKELISVGLKKFYSTHKSSNFGKHLSEDHKNKLLKSVMGKKQSEEHINKISESKRNRPLIQCPHCSMKSRSYYNMKRYHFDNCPENPNLTKEQINQINIDRIPKNKGAYHSEESKIKMSKIALNRPILTCPYCGMQSRSIPNMQRYHFDNCTEKLKENI